MENLLETITKFQNQNPNIYIGGSISLILQEVIPYRIPHDIDIITPNKIHIYDVFKITDKFKHKIVRRHKFDGLIFELFYNPKAKYIEYNWKGNILKLSPIEEVYKWKILDKNIIKEKHLQDLAYLYKNN
jgi:hypothetical protein